jgi:ATP-dependent helicase/nuclease subunit A
VNAPAYRIGGVAVDERRFYAAACDPARSVTVEACAGAGKTWMLVSRIVRALLAGVAPQQILAITFTRKAAGEMRERLDHWLQAFAAADDAGRRAELQRRGLDAAQAAALAPALGTLHERLLAGGRAVEIRTFHGWFAQLLAQAPLAMLQALQLPPRWALVEDPGDLRGELLRAFHRRVDADAALRADYLALVRRHRRATLLDWLDAAWQRRTELLRPTPRARSRAACPTPPRCGPPAPGWRARWRCCTRRRCATSSTRWPARSAGAAAPRPRRRRAACAPRWTAKAMPNARSPAPGTRSSPPRASRASNSASCRRSSRPASSCSGCARWPRNRRRTRTTAAWCAWCAPGWPSTPRSSSAGPHRHGRPRARRAGAAGRPGGLRLGAAAAGPAVAPVADRRVPGHQPAAVAGAARLAVRSYAGAGGGASGQRPLAVFIVGDPKQSIYRFRRAEPRVFEAAKPLRRRRSGRAALLECDHTRRNAPAVIEALNTVFEHAPRRARLGTVPRPQHGLDGRVGQVAALPQVPRDRKRRGRGAAAHWRIRSPSRATSRQALRLRRRSRWRKPWPSCWRPRLAPR